MTDYTTITALTRDDNGALARIDLLCDEDGTPCDNCGVPLTRTHAGTVLKGWGELDGQAWVWRSDGGVAVIVPESQVGR